MYCRNGRTNGDYRLSIVDDRVYDECFSTHRPQRKLLVLLLQWLERMQSRYCLDDSRISTKREWFSMYRQISTGRKNDGYSIVACRFSNNNISFACFTHTNGAIVRQECINDGECDPVHDGYGLYGDAGQICCCNATKCNLPSLFVDTTLTTAVTVISATFVTSKTSTMSSNADIVLRSGSEAILAATLWLCKYLCYRSSLIQG